MSRRRDHDEAFSSPMGDDERHSSGRRRGRSGSPRPGAGVLPASAEPAPRVPRRLRVEGDLHHGLVAALSQLQDPRLASASITQVEMTDDLQLARIHVRLGVGTQDDAEQRKQLMRGLSSAVGRLRGDVARRLDLRYAPQLRFVYDEGQDATNRVDELLAEIRKEDEDR